MQVPIWLERIVREGMPQWYKHTNICTERQVNDDLFGYVFLMGIKRRVVVGNNDLASLYPGVAKAWHPTKCAPPTPDDVAYGSKEKFWWQCSKVKEHSWRTTVYSRTARGSGCGICKGHQKYSN